MNTEDQEAPQGQQTGGAGRKNMIFRDIANSDTGEIIVERFQFSGVPQAGDVWRDEETGEDYELGGECLLKDSIAIIARPIKE
jgi:hypothetical protein